MKNCLKLNTYNVPSEDFEALGSLEVDLGLRVIDILAGLRIEFEGAVGHQLKEHIIGLQQDGTLTPYTTNLLLAAAMSGSSIELNAHTKPSESHPFFDTDDEYHYYRVHIEIESLNGTTTKHSAISAAPTRELATDTTIVNLAEHSSELRWVCNGFAYCDLALKNYRLTEKPVLLDRKAIRENNYETIYYFIEDKLISSGDWLS